MSDFDALYREYAGRVYRFALSLSGNHAVAEDITSETFVRVWTARARLDLTTVLGYLLTIARRLYLQGLRRDRRHGGPMAVEPPDLRPGQDTVAEERSELAAVLSDLQELPEVDRAALLMRAQDELPYDEIACALGITPGAAKVKVHRARQRLAAGRRARQGGAR